MKNLQLAVKAEYFDAIKNGTKHYEYRLDTEYWRKRLVFHYKYDNLIITKGYPRRDDKDRRLVLPYLGWEFQTITHPHFGPNPVNVFAIIITSNIKEYIK